MDDSDLDRRPQRADAARPFAELRTQLSPSARRQAEAQAQAILAKLRRREKLRLIR